MHKLLERQLHKIGLDGPLNIVSGDQFQKLLSHINNTYNESDNERYLLERSMEISSKEMMELNQKLANAQHLAQMGYWLYDTKTKTISCSDEVYNILSLTNTLPSYQKLFHLLDQQYREKMNALFKSAVIDGKDFEFEASFTTSDGNTKWIEIIGYPQRTNASNITKLTGIIRDITKRKELDFKMESLNKKLIESAHRAGMADVATFVLHNLGNVINSLNVSIGIIHEQLESSHYSKLIKLSEMISKHKDSIQDYLLLDPKGKLIPKYLETISSSLKKDLVNMLNEADNIEQQVQHIKDIITSQQDLSGSSEIIEEILLSEIINSAIKMIIPTYIQVKKDYQYDKKLVTDRIKLTQVLVNLLLNAKQSLILNKQEENKTLTVSIVESSNEGFIDIILQDNGVGISKENLDKLFKFGFTTKDTGHGYGLHSSALTIKQIKGIIKGQSDGIGKGATFTISLPLDYNS